MPQFEQIAADLVGGMAGECAELVHLPDVQLFSIDNDG